MDLIKFKTEAKMRFPGHNFKTPLQNFKKLGQLIAYEERKTSINFGVSRSEVKVTWT